MLTILIKYLSFCIDDQDVYLQSAETLCVWEKTWHFGLYGPKSSWASHPISTKFFSSEVDSIEDSFTGVFIVSLKDSVCIFYIVFVPANSQVFVGATNSVNDVTLQPILCFFSHHIHMLYRIISFWILWQTTLDEKLSYLF